MLLRSDRLNGIDTRLADVVRRAVLYLEFDLFVVEGLRTLERQKILVAKGASRTLKSKHLDGRAVDLAPSVAGQLRWDWPLFIPLAAAMKRAADELEVPIVWGGNWKTFRDGPHFESAAPSRSPSRSRSAGILAGSPTQAGKDAGATS